MNTQTRFAASIAGIAAVLAVGAFARAAVAPVAPVMLSQGAITIDIHDTLVQTAGVRTDTILGVGTVVLPNGATHGIVFPRHCGTSAYFNRVSGFSGSAVGAARAGDSLTVTVTGCTTTPPPDSTGAHVFNDLVTSGPPAANGLPAGVDTIIPALLTTLHGDTAILVIARQIRAATDTTAADSTLAITSLQQAIALSRARPRREVDWRSTEGQALLRAAAVSAPSNDVLRLRRALRLAEAHP